MRSAAVPEPRAKRGRETAERPFDRETARAEQLANPSGGLVLGEGELGLRVQPQRQLGERRLFALDGAVEDVSRIGHHGLPLVAWTIIVCLFGCSTQEDSTGPAPSASLADAAPAPVCEERTTRCGDAHTLERCAADGWRREPCPADTPCLDGACAPLRDALTGAALTAAQLLAPRGDGWVDAWTAYGPLPEQVLSELSARPAGPFDGAGEREPLCAASGFVAVQRERYEKLAPARGHLLTGYVVAGRRQPAVLRLGAQGRVRVWLRGALVAERDRPTADPPLRDETLVPIELEPGPNALAVAVLQEKSHATGLWLRIGLPDGTLAREIRFAPSHALGCPLGALLDTSLERRPREGGLALSLGLALRGLAPDDAALRAGLSAHQARTSEPLGQTELPIAALEAGMTLSATLPLDHAGTRRIVADLGGTERSWEVRWHGELSRRIARLAVAELPAALSADSRASLEHGIATVVDNAEHRDASWLSKRTAELEELLATAEGGRDPYEGRTGVVYRAYRSPLDGHLQPFVSYVPPRSKKGEPLPLVIVAHGLGQDPALALRTVIGAAPDDDEDRAFAARHLPPFPDWGVFLAAPSGYGDAGPRALGEEDVLAVIARMRALYRIDERRIALTGYSLGGTVSFVVPLHHPDLFSAAAPLCGYPNLLGFDEVRNNPKAPFEEVMLAKRYIANWAENGLHLPLNIVHGGRDGPQRSAVIADRYRALGYRRIFDIQDELAHNVWDYAYEDGEMIAWLRAQKRPERPVHVRLKSGELRFDRAYWLRIIAFDGGEGFGELDARYLEREKRFEVTSAGVAAFAIDAHGFAAEQVVVDGQSLALAPGRSELSLSRGASGWSLAEPDRRGHKRPGVAGPLDDVLRHPLTIVYGTLDASQTDTNRLVAEHWASWDHWAGAHYPIVADRDARDEALAGRSVVLIGNARSNALTARFVDALAVGFEDGALSFRGKRWAAPDVGISLIRPHPLDPEQYLVLHAGVGYAGTLASRHLPRLSPDFVVYDARLTASRGGELLRDRPVLDAGFFDDAWK